MNAQLTIELGETVVCPMTAQYETLHPGKKCPECGGRGKIYRHVPKYAIAMPGVADDWTYEDQECWRCHGDGIARSLGVVRRHNAPAHRPAREESET